jgi:hypothetical protein
VYGKIFEEIFDSSLMSYGWVHTYTFMSMIVIADKDGYVKLDPRALYRKIGFDVDDRVSFDEFMSAIERLGEEDDLSNLPYHNGRRIIPLHELECVGNRGWWIVNYKHYRDKGGSIEKRREQDAARKRRQREREAEKDECHVTVTQGHVMSAHTDTDTDTDKTTIKPYKFLLADGSTYKPDPDYLSELKRLYPHVDLDYQFLEMESWCLSNPKKRKTRRGATRFINNWISGAEKKRREEDAKQPKTNGFKIRTEADIEELYAD